MLVSLPPDIAKNGVPIEQVNPYPERRKHAEKSASGIIRKKSSGSIC
jgi:hypothetical protein